MLEPCLEVASAGLDHGTRIEAICGEPGERGLIEIVERGEAMLTRWTNVDTRDVRKPEFCALIAQWRYVSGIFGV